MGENKIVILITTGLLSLAAVFFYTIQGDKKEYKATVSSEVQVEQTWELPEDLKEVSAIAFLEPDRIACVQDEAGIIFIYNLKSSEIEREIEFSSSGDYEGLTIHGETAWVMEADGTIYRIKNFMNAAEVESFETSFTTENDMEGFFYDPAGDRLLMAVKERDPNSEDFKGIYEVDPATMELNETPVYKLTFEDKLFDEIREDNATETYFPSEVNRNPETGDLLVLEGRNQRLLVLDSEGNPKDLYRLDRELFPQPEGMTFDPAGNLYISSEGEPGTIHRVTVNQN